ncbi:membrane bound O-acyl transferase family-domain-containing protein [Hypoxylon sp. NC0597]|nr:membrane bound O-acyl transferase family-domain-containing protein [Hypoxylon sp. NC0597]
MDVTAPNTEEQIELQEPTGSIIPHVLLLGVQFIALCGPQFPTRKWLTSAAIIGLSAAAHANQYTDDMAFAHLFALAWPIYLLTLANFMFASSGGPEADLWRVDRPPQEAMSMASFSLQKSSWTLNAMINLRGIRWSSETRNLPKRIKEGEKESKARFLLLQLVDFCWMFLMVDLVSQLGLRLFFIDPTSGKPYVNSKGLSIQSHDMLGSLAKAFVYGAGPYFVTNMQYVACSIVAVILGLSQPEDWPPLYGKLREATTVRKFWSKFWHQMIRKGITSFSNAFARFLGMKKGSTTYSYVHLWTAFAISGAFHAGSMLILPSPVNITQSERTVGILLYFLWQALAITLEDFIQWTWRRVFGPKPPGWSTVVGYVWVVCSFWFSLPLAGDVMVRIRLGQDPPLPFSVFTSLVERVPLKP